MINAKKVYLAGPGVFLPAAEAHAASLAATCRRFGLHPMIPLDAYVNSTGLSKRQFAEALYAANMRMIMQCDAVLADLTPFRGPSADPGTAFEMGVAAALGRPCVAYGVSGELRERVRVNPGSGLDEQGFRVEDLGLQDNLMLCMAAEGRIFRDFEPAAACLADLLSSPEA